MQSHLRRNLGLGGLLFVALFAVTSFLVPEPSSRGSATAVAAKYAGHKTGLAIDAYLIGIAVVVGLAFFWYLRELLAETPSVRRLATIGYAGVILFAASGGLAAGVDLAISDVSGHVSNLTIQTLNVFSNDVGSVLGAGGLAAFLLATGLAVTRSTALPSWLGWVGVVLGVAVLAVPLASGIGGAVWTLIASIVLLATKAPANLAPAATTTS
jgi:hypothetical protein